MEVAYIGAGRWPDTKKIEVGGTENLNNYDLFIVDNQSIFNKIRKSFGNSDPLPISAQRFVRNIVDQIAKIYMLCTNGANAIVVVQGRIPVIYVGGELEAQEFDQERLPIFELANLSSTSGGYARFVGGEYCDPDGYFQQFVTPYVATLSGSGLKPVLVAPSKVAGGEKIVAGYVRLSEASGVVLFVPPPEAMKRRDGRVVGDEGKRGYMRLVQAIANSHEPPIVPEWAQTWSLTPEVAAARSLREKRRAVAKLEREMEDLKTRLQKAQWQLQLFTGDSDPLVSSVERALKELSFAVERGPEGRADLVGRMGDNILAIEIKGYEGATKEYGVVQCQKWKTEIESAFRLPESEWDEAVVAYSEVLKRLGFETPIEDEDEPLPCEIKAVLVSNPYRLTPLDERPSLINQPQQVFSDRIKTRLTEMGAVGLTTLQLLGLFALNGSSEVEAKRALDELLQTNGIYEGLTNWKHFLMPHEASE